MKKTYKIILAAILTFSTFNFQSFSQTAPSIQWQNTVGGSIYDYLHVVRQTSDGGYISGGTSRSDISGDKNENNLDPIQHTGDYWIVKMNTSGAIQWQNTIGGNQTDELTTLQETSDGGYILGGYSISDISGDKTENGIGNFDYWIVKSDGSGSIQWQNTIGGSSKEMPLSIQQTTDGGYIIGGWSGSDISGDKTENSNGGIDCWLVKTDGTGNIQWQNTFGGSSTDHLNSVDQTSDGGYILGGWSDSDISGDKTENSHGYSDYWILKTDVSGNIQWQKTIGGSNMDELYSIQQTADGGYILGGYSNSNISGDKTENSNGFRDYWIVKTDVSGNIQWQNTIGGDSQEYLYSLQQTADGGYILGGHSTSTLSGDKTENSNGAYDYWIVKINTAGSIEWQNAIGGNAYDEFRSIQQTADGGYILGGSSQSNISGDKSENCMGIIDYWIVKLAPDITSIPNLQSSIFNLQFSPNPLTTRSKLTFKNPNKEKYIFTLYDITWRIVETVSTVNEQIILTKGSKQPGVYLFNLTNEKTGERMNGKIVIQ